MAGQDWSITITSSTPAFDPDTQQAENTDLIAWNNRTGDTHQPWQSTSDWVALPDDKITKGAAGCTYLSDPIEPWSSSTPAYVCAAPTDAPSTTIYYICKNHPEDERERGTIVVSK